MRSLTKLIIAYWWRGFFGPFFSVFFPIMLIFIEGEAYLSSPEQFNSIIPGIIVVTILSNGLFTLPAIILEIKESVMFKRIGATKIRPWQFLVVVILFYAVVTILTTLWSQVFAGLLYGWRAENALGWAIAFPSNYGIIFVYVVIALAMGLSMGMVIAALFHRSASALAFANLLYLPIAFLGGSFIPLTIINNSAFLSALTWITPSKYIVTLINNEWFPQTAQNVEVWVYLLATGGFITVFIGIGVWRLKWSN